MNKMNEVSNNSDPVVSSSDTEAFHLTASASKQYATPKRLKLQNTVTPSTEGGPDGKHEKNEQANSEQITIPPKSKSNMKPDVNTSEGEPATPSINLGPRLTAGKSPARAMSLMPRKSPSDASSKENMEATKTASNAVKRNLGSAMKKGEAKSADAEAQKTTHNLPPSQFLAAKISPLRSSTRIKMRDSPRRSEKVEVPVRTRSPLPDISKTDALSPCGMFLTPRTPSRHGSTDKGSASATAPLTPTNFASDFGKGSAATEGIDASGVFAWLHSPTMLGHNGLFSPNGGLTQSLTNTPRGMYGFSGKTPYTPSNNLPSVASSSFFYNEADGVPRREDKNSMICISPLASQKKSAPNASPLSTPVSIDFTKVFATPRLPTPRLSKTAGSAPKKDIQTPVLSSMERNIIDEDLNAMLQLAETTPSGTRSMGFMSPLLTNSLRKMGGMKSDHHPDENLSDLQLPIISGRSSANGMMISPQLAVRSSSNAPDKSKGGKKRKSGWEEHHSYPQPPHSSMLHYHHQGIPPPHGYYPHPPGYPMTFTHAHHPHYPAHAQYSGKDGGKADKSRRKAAKTAKSVIKRAIADDGSFTPSPPNKKPRKSPTKPRRPKSKNALPDDPAERERVASAIRAVNASAGGKNDKAAELAAAIMRGVTCRPSGKWVRSKLLTLFDTLYTELFF